MPKLKLQVYFGWFKELDIDTVVDEHITRTEAAFIAGVSDTTLRRRIEEGTFPEPEIMSDGSHGFNLKKVVAWRKSVDF